MSDIRKDSGIARACFIVMATSLSLVIGVYRSTWMNFFVDTSSFPAFMIAPNICIGMVICDGILNVTDEENLGYPLVVIGCVIFWSMKGVPISIPLLILGCGLMVFYQYFLRNFLCTINIFSTELTPKKPRKSVKKESRSCSHQWDYSGWDRGTAKCSKCGARGKWYINHNIDDAVVYDIKKPWF